MPDRSNPDHDSGAWADQLEHERRRLAELLERDLLGPLGRRHVGRTAAWYGSRLLHRLLMKPCPCRIGKHCRWLTPHCRLLA